MLPTGKQLSIFGQELCLDKAESEHAQWLQDKRTIFLAMLAAGPCTIEDAIGARPEGLHPNSIGALVGALSRSGKIECCGVRPASGIKRRAGLNRVWRLKA